MYEEADIRTEINENLEKQSIINLHGYLRMKLRQNLRKHNGRVCSEEDHIISDKKGWVFI